ncbi:MAG: hypothetical protein K0S44_1079 [Bacteroidetes bacterium]|nr:hypothetical protein [Bacteroidota bacterium]
MHSRLILFLIIVSSNVFSQKKTWDPAVLEKANTAKDADYLTKEEKSVIFYLNLVRLDPKLFGETYLKKYLDSTSDNNQYTKSLRKTLASAKPLPVVYPDKLLSEFAKGIRYRYEPADR